MIRKINKDGMFPVWRGLMWSMIAGISLTSCINNDDDAIIEQDPVAQITMYHASPNAPSLDVYQDDKKIYQGTFDYADYTGYTPFAVGNTNLAFKTTGATNIVLDTTFNLAENKFYSLFLIDRAKTTEALLVTDEDNATNTTTTKIRFINLSPNSPALTLTKEADTTTLVPARDFRQSSAFQPITDGSYTFSIRNAITHEVLATSPRVKLGLNTYYTIIAQGLVDAAKDKPYSLAVNVEANL